MNQMTASTATQAPTAPKSRGSLTLASRALKSGIANPPAARFFRFWPGSRLISIIAAWTNASRGSLVQFPERQPDGQHQERRHLVHRQAAEGVILDPQAPDGVGHLDRQAEALAQRVGETGNAGASAGAIHPLDLARVPRRRSEERAGPLHPHADLLRPVLHERIQVWAPLEPLEQAVGILHRHGPLPLEVLAELAGAHAEVPREERHAVLKDVDVGHAG